MCDLASCLAVPANVLCAHSLSRLGCNDLGDEGAKCIGKAVVANTSQSVTQIL